MLVSIGGRGLLVRRGVMRLRRGPADPVRGEAQCDFPQCGQLFLREERQQPLLLLILAVYFSLFEPFDQAARLDIHQLHLIRLVEYAVRDAFLHGNASDGSDNVVQALDMLNVDRRAYVDSRLQKLFDVLISVFMAAALRVDVGQLVD